MAQNQQTAQDREPMSGLYLMGWAVTSIFFLIGFYHTGVGLSEAKFLGGVYGSFILALGLLLFMIMAYRTATKTGNKEAFILYIILSFVNFVCNFNSLYPNYMGYALIESELKEKLKTYQQFAEVPAHVMAQRANNLPANYEKEKEDLKAELKSGDGVRAGNAVSRIERLLGEKGSPVVINRVTKFAPEDEWIKTYITNTDKAFEAKMNELIPCYNVLKDREGKIVAALKYISRTELGFQREVDEELKKPQSEVKIKERLELIERIVQTYKEHCTAINNSNCRENPEYQKAKCDESIRVKNKDLGRFTHTLPSAYENIADWGTLSILFVCFLIDFFGPLVLFFLLRQYEKERGEREAERIRKEEEMRRKQEEAEQERIRKANSTGRFGSSNN